MLKQELEEILNDLEITDLTARAAAVGVPQSVINSAIDALFANMNPGYRVGVRMAAACILDLIRQYEAKQNPTTIFGRLCKWIFG